MATKPSENKVYSTRDIGASINNALLAASRPEGAEIVEKRLRKLAEYSAAIVAPCFEHVNMLDDRGNPLITAPELVVALLSSALLVHASTHTSGDKLPLVSLAKLISKGK